MNEPLKSLAPSAVPEVLPVAITGTGEGHLK